MLFSVYHFISPGGNVIEMGGGGGGGFSAPFCVLMSLSLKRQVRALRLKNPLVSQILLPSDVEHETSILNMIQCRTSFLLQMSFLKVLPILAGAPDTMHSVTPFPSPQLK